MIGTYDANGWRCIANNPATGVSTWMLPDEGDDVYIQERQDVAALLDENTAIRNVTDGGWKGDGLHSVGRIPLAMAHEKGSFINGALQAQDSAAVAKFLNDSDNSKFRTKEGVL